MKRTHDGTELEVVVKTTLPRLTFLRYRSNPRTEAVRAACYERVASDKEEHLILPNTPIILMTLSEDCEVSRLAYWPADEATGMRVIDALEEALDTNESGHAYNDNVWLLQGECWHTRWLPDLHSCVESLV
jgi:hypothetical protein